MPATSYKHLRSQLLDGLSAGKYVCHKDSVDLLDDINSNYILVSPSTSSLINPFTLYYYIALKLLIRKHEQKRVNHNENFLVNAFKNTWDFFNNVEGRALDEQQRYAVLADEDNGLVIAGAGSGKTTTIVAKIKYLTEILNVVPDSILPISFTAKSAEDIKERINIPGVLPKTFHKFGYDILREVEHRTPKVHDDSGTKLKKEFAGYIETLCDDDTYQALMNSFFINYIRIPKTQHEFATRGEYIQYMKDQNFTTYKKVNIPFHGRETYLNETVKSIEECIIANFLLFNRVEYEYEEQYPYMETVNGRPKKYKPDFTIMADGKDIYLEHLGLDRNGNVPPFFADINETVGQASAKYRNSLDWKRRLHKSNGTKLLETYSYQFSEGTLIESLTNQLTSAGVQLRPMTDKEVWSVISDTGKDQLDAFIELCQTFQALMKSNNKDPSDIRESLLQEDESNLLTIRVKMFLDLFAPIYEIYETNLQAAGEIDFSDMINRAAEYIASGKYRCDFKYIIIDEFQDISFGRARLLEAIRKQNPGVKLFCVGDDWQSIFRFTGSDIALFKDFEDYFGYTYKSRIETTYRFNEPLIGKSSEFILKNPNQAAKELIAPADKGPTTFEVIESEGYANDDTDAVIQALNSMVEIGLTAADKVYIIGRYTFDISRIKNRGKQFSINLSNKKIKYKFTEGKLAGETINLQFLTAHKAKGLEAEYIVIINCNSGKYGFPSGKSDDPILNILLSNADQYENGEERRLFYVAMTRAKNHVTFVTDRYRKSKFILELQEGAGNRTLKCPKCVTGELLLRSKQGSQFYGCSNFSYGCDYTRSIRRYSSNNRYSNYGRQYPKRQSSYSKHDKTTGTGTYGYNEYSPYDDWRKSLD